MFTALIRGIMRSAPVMADVQRVYDDWNPDRPGMGLCGFVARCMERALIREGIRYERWSEDDHFYVVAFNGDDTVAVAIDIPWNLYENAHGDDRYCNSYSYTKVYGHTFMPLDFTFTTIS